MHVILLKLTRELDKVKKMKRVNVVLRGVRQVRRQAETVQELLSVVSGTLGRGRGGEIPEKTRRPVVPFGTIVRCENLGATPPGVEAGSPRWETSSLAATPPRPHFSGSQQNKYHKCLPENDKFKQTTALDISLAMKSSEVKSSDLGAQDLLPFVIPSHTLALAESICHDKSSRFSSCRDVVVVLIDLTTNIPYRTTGFDWHLALPISSMTGRHMVAQPLEQNERVGGEIWAGQRGFESRCWRLRVGETGGTRENQLTSGIPTCEIPGVTRPGIEPSSPWWEVSRLTAQPPRPHKNEDFISTFIN
ncbi:hypothetical protein PR048_021206 [Dryococelus australis]|uniref:Uncharacterized protein n=1 Tax=Dryococelus australis TaxID=614101 RepID=A0ABQ9GXJ0_9NEOP|nr:hypothetical protein PR048_021206 [Dryococelus australis]